MDEALAGSPGSSPRSGGWSGCARKACHGSAIAQRLGIGRTTAWQRWTMALLKIAIRLNAADEQKRPNNKTLNTRAGSVLQGM